MKRLIIVTSVLGALMISVAVLASQANAEAKRQERATVEFTETVKLLDVFLKGQYTIVHDEDKMALGEDCTYVYDATGKLVVSFHCIPVERPKADTFRIVTSRSNLSYGPAEITEYQFGGSTEAHKVPSV